MRVIQIIFVFVFCAFCSGCLGTGSIYRESNIGDSGNSIILDARQRVVTNMPAKSWGADASEDGPPRYISPDRIVCPEPSPDVASSLSQAITASLSNVGNDGSRQSAAASYASAESLAQLGQRLATTQLLRDELSDLCRSYANGAISTTNYTLRLAQLDEKMVTLLTAEMVAGAFQRDSVAISGSTAFAGGGNGGSGSGDVAAKSVAITTAENKRVEATDKLEAHLSTSPTVVDLDPGASDVEVREAAAQNEANRDSYDAKTRLLEANLRSAEDEVARARADYSAAQIGNESLGAPAAGATILGGTSSSYFGGRNDRAAEHLVTLQSNYLDRDQLGGIVDTCLTRLNEQFLFSAAEVSEADRQTLASEIESLEASLDNANERWAETASGSDEEARIEAEMETLQSRISNRRAQLDGLGFAERGFHGICQSMIDRLATQFMTAQNKKLALKLKAMEAKVQVSLANSSTIGFCTAYIQRLDPAALQGAEEVNSDPFLQQCLTVIREYRPQPVLGSLDEYNGDSVAYLGSRSIDY